MHISCVFTVCVRACMRACVRACMRAYLVWHLLAIHPFPWMLSSDHEDNVACDTPHISCPCLRLTAMLYIEKQNTHTYVEHTNTSHSHSVTHTCSHTHIHNYKATSKVLGDLYRHLTSLEMSLFSKKQEILTSKSSASA